MKVPENNSQPKWKHARIYELSLAEQSLDKGLWFQGEASQLPAYSLHQGLSW